MLFAQSMPKETKPTAAKAFAKRAEPLHTSIACGVSARYTLAVCLELPICSLIHLLAFQNLLRKPHTCGDVCVPLDLAMVSNRSKSDSSDNDTVAESDDELCICDGLLLVRCCGSCT